jgi:hypothetical protein
MVDLDNDGTLELVLTHLYAAPSLYKNTLYDKAKSLADSSVGNHWIGFQLAGDGTTCSKDAAASRVVVSYAEAGQSVKQLSEVQIVNAFAAQGDKRAHFGLGNFVGQVDVSVSWCGAPLQSYGAYASDRYHAITQTQK